jgi:GWxTD domain-containing protein
MPPCRKIFYCALLISLAVTVIPVCAFEKNDAPVRSEGELLFYLDTASFRARSRQTYQEFYYLLPFSELKFQEVAGGLLDSMKVEIEIEDTLKQVLVQDSWPLLLQAGGWQELEGRFLPDLFEMTLSPGKYRLQMKITEIHSGKIGVALLDFDAVSFIDEHLAISQIQFASRISPDSTGSNSKFTKNSLNILPNPNRVFGRTLPVLYFYTEIYDLKLNDGAGNYVVSYQIIDFDGQPIKKFPARTKHKRDNRALEVGAVNLATLNNAAYFLQVSIQDLDSGDSVSVRRGFWHKIEEVVPRVVSLENNVIQALENMSENELELHFRQLKYIIPGAQAKLYQKLNPDARQHFLISLWQGLDPVLTTPENEFWNEFQERVRYANQQYAAGFQEGWRTDCGRILIRYGIPNDIVRRDSRSHAKPYQEWFYNREGGFKFIFVDEEGLGKYRLVYSSVETEYTDPNWRYLLGE